LIFPLAVEHGKWAQIDVRGEELLDELAEGVGLFELLELAVEVELIHDLLNVGRETVQVFREIGPKLLWIVEETTEREQG